MLAWAAIATTAVAVAVVMSIPPTLGTGGVTNYSRRDPGDDDMRPECGCGPDGCGCADGDETECACPAASPKS